MNLSLHVRLSTELLDWAAVALSITKQIKSQDHYDAPLLASERTSIL